MENKNYISISFDDEVPLLQAVKKLKESNEIICDVMTPFPVVGMEEALEIKRTRIPVGGFIFGAIGAILAFGFQTWVFTVSYPLIIGGKPYFAAPAFIPITFELTVLFSGLAMASALLIISGLKPDIRFKPVDERITDDRFIIFVNSTDHGATVKRVTELLTGIDILEIR
jgi:Alternative complex III, ActD subunit